jgi:hypothetical protein
VTPQRRILVVLESRATYGYSKNVMLRMADVPSLALTTLVTGAHLSQEFGNSIELIRGNRSDDARRRRAQRLAAGAWKRHGGVRGGV